MTPLASMGDRLSQARTPHEIGEEYNLADYVDAREIVTAYREETCWNCGNTKYVRRQWRVCRECFMGQHKVDEELRGDCETDEGYTDYRLLWYGDIPIEEARRKFERSTKSVRERMDRRDARDRAVRL